MGVRETGECAISIVKKAQHSTFIKMQHRRTLLQHTPYITCSRERERVLDESWEFKVFSSLLSSTISS